jgi:hypothetical protein
LEPIHHETCNVIFQLAEGTEEYVKAIHVNLHREAEQIVLTSYWKPTREELALLNKGSAIDLSILDYKHPAVRLSVTVDPITI